MKYQKPHTKLLYLGGLVVILTGIALVSFATPYIPKAYLANWGVLAIILLVCITPLGHKKLVATKNEKPRHNFVPWLLRIFALETSLFLTFLGILQVCAYGLPVITPQHPSLFLQTSKTLFIQLGLFPWTIFALFAGRIGYQSYCKNKDAPTSVLAAPLFSCEPESLGGLVLNLESRVATMAALSTSFAFMTLLILSLITPPNLPFLTGFHAKTTIIAMAVILFGFTQPFKRLFARLLNPKIPLFLSLIIVLVIFAVFMLLLNALFFGLGKTPIHMPAIIQWIEDKNWVTLWIVFSLTWWACWTPLITSHIARLSRGHRIRSTMIATLVLPAFFTCLLVLFPGEITSLLNKHPYLLSLIALAGFIYLLWRLTEKTVLPILIRSYLPKRDYYKRRNHPFYFRKVFQLMLIFIYLYLPAGIAIISVVLFATTLRFATQILINVIASALQIINKTPQ